MAKIIISYNEVADINDYLQAKGIEEKVHMHDMCGSQSFTIKTSGNMNSEQSENIKNEIAAYFNHKGIELKFAESNLEFVIKQK